MCDYIVSNIILHEDKAKIYPMSFNCFSDMWDGLQVNFHVLSTLLAVNYFPSTLVSTKSHPLQYFYLANLSVVLVGCNRAAITFQHLIWLKKKRENGACFAVDDVQAATELTSGWH